MKEYGIKIKSANQFGFHSKAPFEVHSDCEVRLDIPVPATKKKSAVTKVKALFLFTSLSNSLFNKALFFQTKREVREQRHYSH
jgi:hypothetical protein